MNVRVVGWYRGAAWLGEGWRLFRASPFGWLALVALYWVLMTVVSRLPWIGIAVASALVPAFSLGFMAAARATAAGARPEAALLFEGFRAHPGPQIALGMLYAALLALLVAATAIADDGTLARWLLTGRRPEPAEAEDAGFLAALALTAALYLLLSMLYWFAPQLVSWHGFSVGKALFYSFFAVLRNWRAFLAYGAATLVVTAVIPFVALTALLWFAGEGSSRIVATLLLPMVLMLMPTLFASFFASYRDVFGGDGPQAG